jgi:hypothetical protein
MKKKKKSSKAHGTRPRREPPPFRVRSVTVGEPDQEKTDELVQIVLDLINGKRPRP